MMGSGLKTGYLIQNIAYHVYIFFTICLLLISFSSHGQQKYEPVTFDHNQPSFRKHDSTFQKACEIKDFGDIFRELFHKKNKEKHKKKKPPRSEKKVSMLILPNISYNPANGLLIGVGGNLVTYLGPRESTRLSAIGFTLAVTTKKQFISFIKTNLYTADNRFFFSGDWRFYKYSESTYGLGTNSPDSLDTDPSWGWQGAEVGNGVGYSMLYNYVILHEIANMKVVENFYLGIGYQLDYYWNIKDQSLNLDTIPAQITPHWGYSKRHGFDTAAYAQSGMSINAMYDSRDNQINPYEGIYARLNYRMNPTWLGSTENSTELWLEFRTYVGLSKKIPRHLIAFWFFGNFLVSGNQPYLTLMALGNDQKARSGRGYTEGRFRGQDYMYGEVEYRFPLIRCAQTLGGVIFVNASTASNRDRGVKLFNYVSPAIGFGLRILVNKHTRMNIAIDFGIGLHSKGIYFGGTEAF